MQKISIFTAKTHLPEIIHQVQKGAEICLMNLNQEMAFIISAERYHREKNTLVFSELKELLKTSPLGIDDEIVTMKNMRKK